MKKIQRLTLILCLVLTLALLALFTACKRDGENLPEEPNEPPPHTNNEVAAHFYGYSLLDQMLFRYDFNAAGRPLGAVAVDWYTLEPLVSMGGGSVYDRRYEYDHNGRLIGHTIHNAALTLEYDELGNPVRGIGFAHNGAMITVTYTCSEQGDILSEQLAYRAPAVELSASHQVLYTYDEDGRLINENHLSYSYGENSVSFEKLYKGNYHTAIMTWNELGDIVSLTFSEESKLIFPDQTFLYEWSYDEDGKCISSRGNTFDYGWDIMSECQIERNENGCLTEATVIRKCDVQGADIRDERYCLTYDEAGVHTQTVVHWLGEDGNDTRRYILDFTNGFCVKHLLYAHISADDSGAETIGVTILNEYDPVTKKMIKTCQYQKDSLSDEWLGEYDELGRLVMSIQKEYEPNTDGVLYREERFEYEYRKTEDVAKRTITTTYPSRDSWESSAYEYENGVVVRVLIEGEYTDQGKRIRKWVDRQIDPETETAIHSILKMYEDGVLTDEEEWTVDYLSEHIWTKIFDRTIYTDGKISLKVRSEDLDDGRMIEQEKQYENDILVLDKTTRKEPGLWTNGDGEWKKYSRPTSETYVYYGEDGSFDRREEWEYAYHENGYRSETLCKTYDSENKLLSYRMETYDEMGNLITDVTG